MVSIVSRGIVAGLVAFAVAVTAGIAYALITANVVTPSLDVGAGQGTGGTSCQTGSAITFTWPTPTWSNVEGDYLVSTLEYSNITSACVTLGTADMTVNIVASGGTTSVANATASNMGAATGTLNLSTPLTFDVATNAAIKFYVKNA